MQTPLAVFGDDKLCVLTSSHNFVSTHILISCGLFTLFYAYINFYNFYNYVRFQKRAKLPQFMHES